MPDFPVSDCLDAPNPLITIVHAAGAALAANDSS
jgi:hypothetical protein